MLIENGLAYVAWGVMLKAPVATKAQTAEIFQTSRPANAIFCHQEFLEKLAEHNNDAIGKRISFLMQRLAVDAQRLHYKSTQGMNRGWRRSRLGGGQGSHFYAWWAPKSAAPFKESEEFGQAPDGSLFLRDIRHHDDHSLLNSQSFDANYLPITVEDLRRDEYAPPPWTQTQVRFATARQSVRLLKGHPGSGKTTALLHAADACPGERVLYVTYSHNLATLAREYFDRFCSSRKTFEVITFPELIRQLLNIDVPFAPLAGTRRRFTFDVIPFVRGTGVWAAMPWELYDEFHAHLIGDALPLAIGRFQACPSPRVSDTAFRERRARFLGGPATAAAIEGAERLEKADASGTLAERYFPELALAWKAVQQIQQHVDARWLSFDCIAVDECQDLTPIEALVITELARQTNQRRRGAAPLLISGDEAQTVRPTDFEWGWLSDLLHTRLTTPTEFNLSTNLRSPQRIAQLVNRVWDLYSLLQKHERPSGRGMAEIEDDATDQILYCSTAAGPELDDLLINLANREGLALITLEERIPDYVPQAARTGVLTASEAKGLDFNSVCILDPGKTLADIKKVDFRNNSGREIDAARRRLSIDRLRVALSRPTERLYWLDVNPSESDCDQSIDFLNQMESDYIVTSCVASALLKTIEESDLDLEERVQRCQADARQLLEVKPDMAWSRAHQAVTLLGIEGTPAAVSDQAAREAAYLTLAEVAFVLGIRKVKLAPELGRPSLFLEARMAALGARRGFLSEILEVVRRIEDLSGGERLQALVDFAQIYPSRKPSLEPWVVVELDAKAKSWITQMEMCVFDGHDAGILLKVLPPLYQALDIPDWEAKLLEFQQRALILLMKDKQYANALAILQVLPRRNFRQEAICHEGLGDFRGAAEAHVSYGNLKAALTCYRSIPDPEAALSIAEKIPDHPATESLRWMAEMHQLIHKRPEKFTKMVSPAEKKLLEDMLERSFAVTRKKPEPKPKATRKPVRKPPPR